MTARDFEFGIAQRVTKEIQFSLRRFLKSYSVLVKKDHVFTDVFYNYFLMTYPGRFVCADAPRPLISHFLRTQNSSCRQTVDVAAVKDGIEFTYRKFSRFEKQIFELKKLIDNGSYALALVGSLSLVEWVLKLSAPEKYNDASLHKLIGYFTGVISSDLKKCLLELKDIRNEVVHLEHHSSFGDKRAHEIYDIDLDQQIDRVIAVRAMDAAWSIFCASNKGHLKQN